MRLVTYRYKDKEQIGVQIDRDGEAYIQVLDQQYGKDHHGLHSLLGAGTSALDQVREFLALSDSVELIPEKDVVLLAPLPRPGKILCLGHNYEGHIGQGRTVPPEYPTIFCKTANTIIGPGQPIVLPRLTEQLDYEAELAVIIGQGGRDIPETSATEHIAGYTIFNDVSARDIQKRTSQWMLGKSFDTFGPLGPALVSKDEIPDPHSLELELTVNGVPKQRANTHDMIFSIPYLVSYLSSVMTLEPGDIIATGTPAKLPEAAEPQRFLEPGDVVCITIEKIGILSNPVVSESVSV